MSRKRKAPVRKIYSDPKYGSKVISKFINSIMYDGKRSTAERILYTALDKIKETKKEDPLKVFNTAISNVRPNIEVRSRSCLLYTSPSPRDRQKSRMPSSA